MAKKITKSSKVSKVSAPVAPSKEEGPRKAWNAGITVAHHSVLMNGKPFTSTWKAFEGTKELASLSRGQHMKFRKVLKATPGGKLAYVHPETKKEYKFELVK